MPEADDALRARLQMLFLEELEEHLERLEQGFAAIAASLPDMPAGILGDLFRSAHSLKGAAAAVGAPVVASVCHQLEDALARMQDGALAPDQDLVDRMIRLLDVLAGVGAALRRGEDPGPVDVPELLADTPQRPVPDGSARAGAMASAAAQPEPTRAGGLVGDERGALRVARSRLDAVLVQAGDVMAASHRSEQVIAACVRESRRLRVAAEQWTRDRIVLHRALGAAADQDESLRTALERLDARGPEAFAQLDRLATSARAHQRAVRGVTTGFVEAVRQARAVPFSEATAGLARMVRDLCDDLGKRAQLTVHAAEVEIDKDLVSTLHDVLGHALRNAVDHGIESPEERAAAGKPASGTIAIHAGLSTTGIEVTVADDGRGVDLGRAREAAEALGLAMEEESETDLTRLFHPGLSTAGQVSEVSGRGVGLDAMRASVEGSGGTISMESEPGQGTRVRITMPLTLSTVRVLLARVATETIAFPTSSVRRLLAVHGPGTRLDGAAVVEYAGAVIPLVRLSDALGWETAPTRDADPTSTGLVIEGGDGRHVAITVDEALAEQEVVLRAAPARLAAVSLLLGTTQLEDGSTILVLSPPACARHALAAAARPAPEPVPEVTRVPRVLLVEDTITTRELERSILVEAGYAVVVAVDGQQAWEMLQAQDFDVVVSDVVMPRMDGIALCRAIRESRRHAHLPVVLVTSLHSDVDRRRGLDAGADAYLAKSGFDRAELLATLEQVL